MKVHDRPGIRKGENRTKHGASGKDYSTKENRYYSAGPRDTRFDRPYGRRAVDSCLWPLGVFRLLHPDHSLVRITFHGLRDSGGGGRRGELIMSSGVQVTLNVAAVGECGTTVGVGTVSGSTGRVGLPGDLGGSRDIGACCGFVSALLVVKDLQCKWIIL